MPKLRKKGYTTAMRAAARQVGTDLTARVEPYPYPYPYPFP